MDRRSAIRNLVIASAGTLVWAGCKEQYVNVLSLYSNGRLELDMEHKSYLNKISETFLPLEDLAEGMDRPADFMMRMINNLQSSSDVMKFAQGFESYKAFMKAAQLNIATSNPEVALGMVKELISANPPMDDLLGFVNSVRGYSIWNLKSSEHYMTEYQEYAMVPPPFNGNAPV